jgi:hypothetical protein
MTVRQRRSYIKEIAKSLVSLLKDIEDYSGSKPPFALSEEEFGWQQKALDYAHMLSDIDINEKPDRK